MSSETKAIEVASAEECLIATHAWDCLQVFENGTTSLPGDILGPRRSRLANLDFKNDFELFRVWLRNLGVFARNTASVDYRLRDARDIRKSICSLLDALRETIQQGIGLVANWQKQSNPLARSTTTDFSSESSSDEDDDDVENMDAEEAPSTASKVRNLLEDISNLVEKLVKISVAIRKSGSKARNLRADAWEDEHENGTEIAALVKESLNLILEKRYGLVDPLRSRICEAICRQKHRIRYWRAHQKKLSLGEEFMLSSQERRQDSAPKPSFEALRIIAEIKPQVKIAGSHISHLTGQTEATRYTKIELDVASHAAIMPRSTISSRSHASKATVPKPPFVQPGMKYFQCPYCCIFLARENAESVTKWRIHVTSDLCPFVCLNSTCTASNVQFDKENEWFEHHKKYHAQEWWCDGSDPPHAPQLFHDPETFTSHIQRSHTTQYSESQIGSLIQMSQISAEEPFDSCPFCDITACNTESSFNQRKEITPNLRSHIANHLIDLFVTFALPQEGGADEELSNRTLNSFKRSTLDQLSGSEHDISGSFSTLSVSENEFEDEGIEDRSDFDHQWGFIPKLQDVWKERTQIAQWLGAVEDSIDFRVPLQKRHPFTGRWLLDGEFYVWMQAEISLLCIYGIPGCGKTVLSATIVHYLNQVKESDPNVDVGYFFFDSASLTNRSWKTALRTILFQLAQQSDHAREMLEDSYRTHEDGRRQLDEMTMKLLFRDIMDQNKHRYIILDAVDECKDSPIPSFLNDNLSYLNSGRLQLVISSRRVEDFVQSLATITSYELRIQEEDVMKDVSAYIEHQLVTDLSLTRWPKVTQDEIFYTMMEKADGRFRWVQSQLDVLRQCTTLEALRNVLSSFSTILDETYDSIWQQLGAKDNLSSVIRLCQWLRCAQRSVRLSEMRDILALLPGTDVWFSPEARLASPADVLEVSFNLFISRAIEEEDFDYDEEFDYGDTTIAGSDQLFLPVHSSLLDYLISDRCYYRYYFTVEPCNQQIAEDCLRYVLYLGTLVPLRAKIINQFPLAQYATKYWWRHVRDSGTLMDTPLANLLSSLLSDRSAALLAWVQLYDPENQHSRMDWSIIVQDLASPVYYAALLGLSNVIEEILLPEADINVQGGKLNSPLLAASLHGHADVVKTLLQYGADVNAQGSGYGNALQAACSNGHVDVARTLLLSGANVNAQGGYDGNALQAASRAGQLETVRLLLDNGANVNAKGGLNDNALRAASRAGHLETVKVLLDRGAQHERPGRRI